MSLNSLKDSEEDLAELAAILQSFTNPPTKRKKYPRVRSARLPADKQKTLVDYCSKNSYPNQEELILLATQLEVPCRRLKIWFQNYRARLRREAKLLQTPVTEVNNQQ
jgi:hypothetical protein